MWYSVKVLNKCVVAGKSPDEPQLWEESIILLKAKDPNAAHDKAISLGKDSQTSFRNKDGARVSWRFLHVLEVQELTDQKIKDGVEVYYQWFWRVGVGGKVENKKGRAKRLRILT
jgi:hypothetical protein